MGRFKGRSCGPEGTGGTFCSQWKAAGEKKILGLDLLPALTEEDTAIGRRSGRHLGGKGEESLRF